MLIHTLMNALSNTPILESLKTGADKLLAISDNLANSATPGYKRIRISQQPFDKSLQKAVESTDAKRSLGPGTRMTDFSEGAIRVTSNPLDFAIQGSGFFVVKNGPAEYLTRNGGFHVGADGKLITEAGYEVQGESGTISLSEDLDRSQLSVRSDGSIYSGEQMIGRLKVVNYSDLRLLQSAGTTLFKAPADLEEQPQGEAKVLNQAIEGSNSCVFEEMAELITSVRTYESCQKMIKMLDQTEGETIKYLS